jgi:hypothetical protein
MNSTTNTKVVKTATVKATKKIAVIPEPEPVLIEDEEEEEEEDEAVIAELEKHFTPAQREASKAERAKRVRKPALSAKHKNMMAACYWFVSNFIDGVETDVLLEKLHLNSDLATQTAFYSQFDSKAEMKGMKGMKGRQLGQQNVAPTQMVTNLNELLKTKQVKKNKA